MNKRWASLLIGVAGSLFFLWLGFRGLDWNELWGVLQNINIAWVVVAIPVYFVAVYILTWRWYFLLRPVKDVHPNRLYPVVVIGYMANNLLPFRLGEVMRAYVLKRRDDIAIPPALTTILVERVFDGLIMLTFIFTALLFVEFEEARLRTIILLTTPLFFGAMGVFFWLATITDRTRKLYTAIVNTVIPSRLRDPILHLADDLMSGFEALRSWQALGLVIFYSVLSWTIEASTYWLVMQAFDFSVSFYVLLLVIGFGNLATILPSTAGYIGTFHTVAILTLTAFGIERVEAASYALVMHATLWLPIIVFGLFYLVRLGFGLRDIQQAEGIVHDEQQPGEVYV